MTIDQHDARCSKVLYVDLPMLEMALQYGGAARLYCIDGHSAYTAVPKQVEERQDVPEVSEEVPNPRGLCCCGAEYDMGPQGRRKYCPPCAREHSGANVLKARAARRRVRHCRWTGCDKVLEETQEQFCCSAHRKIAYDAYNRARADKHRGKMAAAFA